MSVVSLRCSVQSSRLTNEDARGRFGAHDMPRELERIDGGIAAHESDHGALDGTWQFAALDEFEIEPRRGQPGAARD